MLMSVFSITWERRVPCETQAKAKARVQSPSSSLLLKPSSRTAGCNHRLQLPAEFEVKFTRLKHPHSVASCSFFFLMILFVSPIISQDFLVTRFLCHGINLCSLLGASDYFLQRHRVNSSLAEEFSSMEK